MRIPVMIIATLLMTSPTYAGGFLDNVARSLNLSVHDAGRAIEKGAHDTGNAIEKGTQDAGHAIEKPALDARSFVQTLIKKTDEELISLSLSIDPCSQVECRGLPSEIARQAVSLVRSQKQNDIDLEVRRSQAWAAEVSAALSFLSLIISILSFVRAGRRAPGTPSPSEALTGRPLRSGLA